MLPPAGNVVAAPAPQAHHHHLANARDSRGDLWIEAFRADPNDPEWHLWRISHDRAEPTIRMPKGRKVYLIDHDDNLWLGPVGGEGVGPSDFVIVRDGERVGRVDCPVRIHPGAIVSGGPGWVYAVSARGLEHFVAPDDRPGDYRLEPHRPLDHAYRHDKTRPSPMRGQDIRLAAGRRLVVEAHMGVNSTAPREVNGRQIIPLPDPR
jgi:hypothetical protein